MIKDNKKKFIKKLSLTSSLPKFFLIADAVQKY